MADPPPLSVVLSKNPLQSNGDQPLCVSVRREELPAILDSNDTLQEFRASVGAQWAFLSDPERTIQKDLDIQEYTDPEHNPMIPHTLVLKPGLVIYSIYNGYWFWGPRGSPKSGHRGSVQNRP
jgi:hypothetical protein